MSKKTKNILIIAFAVLVIGLTGYFIYQNQNINKPQYSNLDTFAKCIANSGAKFYGAFWCPHCKEQKAEFGSSEQYVPYVECSTADGKDQMQVCKDANITAYPTWVFADGSRESGALSFPQLASKTGCQLTQTK